MGVLCGLMAVGLGAIVSGAYRIEVEDGDQWFELAERQRQRRLHIQPKRELAGPLLGFVSPDGEGKEGLELSLEHELKGHQSEVRGLRDRSGRLLFSEGIEDEQALAGHNVYLTIDKGIQFTAERELE